MTAKAKINETKKGRQTGRTSARRRSARAHGGSKGHSRTQPAVASIAHATVGHRSGASRRRASLDVVIRRGHQSWFDAGTGDAAVHLTLSELTLGTEFHESLKQCESVLAARTSLASLAQGKGFMYLALVDSELMSEDELEGLLADAGADSARKLETEVVRRLHEIALTMIRQLGFDPEKAKSASYSGPRTHFYLGETRLGAEISGARMFDISGLKALRPKVAAYIGYAMRKAMHATACSTPYDIFCHMMEGYSGGSFHSVVYDYVNAGRSDAARERGWQDMLLYCEGEADPSADGAMYIYSIGYREDFDHKLSILADVYDAWKRIPGWDAGKSPPVPKARTSSEALLIDWANRAKKIRAKLKRRGMTLDFDWDDHRCFFEGNLLFAGAHDERLMKMFWDITNDGSGECPGMLMSLGHESKRLPEFVVAASLAECAMGELESLLERAA